MPLALREVQALKYDQVAGDKALRLEVLRTYYRLFGDEPCGNCNDKLKGYLSKIKAYRMSNVEVSKEFKFKDGVTGVPMQFGSRDILTPSTLTTERAIVFLRANPNRIKLFSKAPENWREMLVDEVKKDGRRGDRRNPRHDGSGADRSAERRNAQNGIEGHRQSVE